MQSCQQPGLRASADTQSWKGGTRNTSKGAAGILLTCCATTATQCNLCFGGCTICGIAYRLLYITLAVLYLGPVLVAIAVYAAIDWQQHVVGPQEHLQLAQGATALIAAAAALQSPGFVWLAFMAAIVHVARALMLMELRSLGDCRRCCNEGSRCTCGKRKVPLPAGTLARIASALGQLHLRNNGRTQHPRISSAHMCTGGRSGISSSS